MDQAFQDESRKLHIILQNSQLVRKVRYQDEATIHSRQLYFEWSQTGRVGSEHKYFEVVHMAYL